ncbi:hypothetical protein D187_003821 [Cystobacter fuscus DSM 2262]|uniref:SH3b domain-containing protein n=1 Tax=Cystobacter fuscus (strain ATCC 25194 / DSM 2262 / NBRC 100088 / M29) TaxID=1242864 RepID=S9QPX3_CYSF2|nr:hypothetical protein [Cystobacter fuscus]EPX58623.1 hypothetical protein D187_003821 [Cystobacter fuscus DSM 2262]
MRKRTSGFHLRSWALCLGVIWGTPGRAQEAGSVYIQGSEVNLRGGASTDGEVVKKVLIGTECQKLEGAQKKGWVRLKCGEAEGFTLEKLVGADKPNLETLLAQAQDAAKSAKERLDAAARAATLEPQNEQASQLLTQLFFDVNFEQLAKDKRKGGLHESFLVVCNPRGMQNPRTHEQCLTDELEKIEYDWHQLSIRDDRFVSAMFREGNLVVYTGHMKSRAKGRFDPEDDEFNIVIESRSRSPIADALKASLQKGARSADPDANRYSNFEGEYAGMPVLSPAAYRIFRSLPSVWYNLTEWSGERYILVNCGSIVGRVLHVDVHHRASIQRSDLPRVEDVPQTDRIKDISKNDSVHHFELCNYRGCQTSQTLTWPTDEPGIARWKTEQLQGSDGKAHVLNEYFSTNKGAPNEVRYHHCYEGIQ